MTSIKIPNSVTSIGVWAFGHCSSLQSISIPFVGATLNGTENTHFGYIFGASTSNNNYILVPSSLKEVIITGGKSIRNNAFEGCYYLTSVTMASSVTSIGEWAFGRCYDLRNVTIRSSIININDWAFSSIIRNTRCNRWGWGNIAGR